VGAPSGGAPQLSRDSQDGLLEYFGKQQLGREASCSPILQAAHAAAVKRGLDGLGDGTRSAALPTPPTTPAAARRQLDGAASSSAGAGAFKQESYSAALAAEQQGGSWRATQGAALDPECKGRDGGSGGQRSRREGGSPTAVLHCRDDSGLPSGSESGLRSGSVALGSAGCVSAVSSVAQSPRPPAAASFGNSTSGRLSLSAPPISTGGDLVIYSSGGSSMGASRSASRRASSLQLSVRSASGEGAPSRRHTALVVMPCSDSEEEELEAPPRRRATSLHRRLSGVYEGHHVQLRKLKRQMGDTAGEGRRGAGSSSSSGLPWMHTQGVSALWNVSVGHLAVLCVRSLRAEAPADLLALMARRVFTSQSALATVSQKRITSAGTAAALHRAASRAHG
jgi:hypothetical protein